MSVHANQQLGRVIRIFRSLPLGWRDVWFLLLPGALAVVVPLLYGYNRFRSAYTVHGPVPADQWSRPWYTLALIALCVFFIAAHLRIRVSHQFVAVHEKGIKVVLDQRRILRWEEIAGVSTQSTRYHLLGLQLRERYAGILYPNTGKPIHLNGAIQGVAELLSMLKARLYPRLLPNLQENFENGQWLYFGPLAIQKDGIKLIRKGVFSSKQTITWSQVSRIQVRLGYLVVELSDKTSQKIPVSNIPNIELLLQLIQMGVNS